MYASESKEFMRFLLCYLRDPQTEDETEFLENMFDALCSCMLLPENRAKFVEVCISIFLLMKRSGSSSNLVVRITIVFYVSST